MRDAADAARAGIDRLLGHKVLRRESAGVSTESALRGARASAALEGVDVPLAELRAGDVDDPVVQGALRVSAALGSMVETWSRAPGPGARPAARAGRRRPRRPRPTSAGRRRTPARGCPGCSPWSPARRRRPPSSWPRSCTASSPRWPRSAPPTASSPAPPAGSPGSPAAWTRRRCRCPRSGFAELGREAYAAALAGYASGTPDGVAGWLVHCCRATEHGALEGLAICESLLRG